MNLRRSSLGIFLLVVSFAAPLAGDEGRAAKLPPRFQQVRDRIDALFAERGTRPPAPTLIDNPFRPPGAVAPVSVGDEGRDPAPAAQSSDLQLLQQAVATLRVTGIFEVAGVLHLVINARPYKNGDVLQAVVDSGTVYLRVREVTRSLVTLALNEAEMTLKY